MNNENHPWDMARRLKLMRRENNHPRRTLEEIDRGVNYFVLQLERLGARTLFSCEGHGDTGEGFYVSFEAPYRLALKVKAAGYFTVEIWRERCWTLRVTYPFRHRKDKAHTLRRAAESWEKAFGPLQDSVMEPHPGDVSQNVSHTQTVITRTQSTSPRMKYQK